MHTEGSGQIISLSSNYSLLFITYSNPRSFEMVCKLFRALKTTALDHSCIFKCLLEFRFYWCFKVERRRSTHGQMCLRNLKPKNAYLNLYGQRKSACDDIEWQNLIGYYCLASNVGHSLTFGIWVDFLCVVVLSCILREACQILEGPQVDGLIHARSCSP